MPKKVQKALVFKQPSLRQPGWRSTTTAAVWPPTPSGFLRALRLLAVRGPSFELPHELTFPPGQFRLGVHLGERFRSADGFDGVMRREHASGIPSR